MRTKLRIKPCPYCGSTATPHIHERYGIECDNIECGMGLACICDTLEEAIKRWNRRDPIDRIVEQLEKEKHYQSAYAVDKKFKIGIINGFNKAIEIVKKGGA